MSSSLEAWRGSQDPALRPAAAAGYRMPPQGSAVLWASSRCLSGGSALGALPGRGSRDVPWASRPRDAAARGCTCCRAPVLASGWAGGGEQAHGTNIHSPHPAVPDVVSSFNCLSAGQPLKGDATAQSHKAHL